MPELVPLDEQPLADPENTGGTVPCPECERAFSTEAGMKRHVTRTHNGAPSTGPSPSGVDKGRVEKQLADRWSQFQIGCSTLIAMACVTCGKILAADAVQDGNAIATFASKRPKLRKQLESFLSSADFLILMGAVGQTAQKMIAHHSIGRRIGIGTGHAESSAHDVQGKLADYMSSLPPEARHQLLDQALQARRAMTEARQSAAAAAAQAHSQAARASSPSGATAPDVPTARAEGVEPEPDRRYSEQDRELLARINAGSDFADDNMMADASI